MQRKVSRLPQSFQVSKFQVLILRNLGYIICNWYLQLICHWFHSLLILLFKFILFKSSPQWHYIITEKSCSGGGIQRCSMESKKKSRSGKEFQQRDNSTTERIIVLSILVGPAAHMDCNMLPQIPGSKTPVSVMS